MIRDLASLAALLAAALTTGCAHVHLPGNQPGGGDIRKPPEKIAARGVEEPDDPGEHLLALSYGVLLGGGATESRDGRLGPSSQGGTTETIKRTDGGTFMNPEVTLQYGRHAFSHVDDGLFGVFPQRALGANIGWTGYTGEEKARMGPLYIEAQYRDALLFALAAGWAADLGRATHGPQVTLSIGPLYGRITHLIDGGNQLHLGLMLKASTVFVWSR